MAEEPVLILKVHSPSRGLVVNDAADSKEDFGHGIPLKTQRSGLTQDAIQQFLSIGSLQNSPSLDKLQKLYESVETLKAERDANFEHAREAYLKVKDFKERAELAETEALELRHKNHVLETSLTDMLQTVKEMDQTQKATIANIKDKLKNSLQQQYKLVEAMREMTARTDFDPVAEARRILTERYESQIQALTEHKEKIAMDCETAWSELQQMKIEAKNLQEKVSGYERNRGENLKRHGAEVARLQTAYDKLFDDFQDNRKLTASLDEEIKTSRKEVDELTQQVSDITAARDVLQKANDDLNQKLQNVDEEYKESFAQLIAKDTEIAEKDEELNMLAENLDRLQEEWQDEHTFGMQKEKEAQDLQAELRAMRADTDDMAEAVTELQKRMEEMGIDNDELDTLLTQREREVDILKNELELQKRESKEWKSKFQMVRKDKKQLLSSITEFKNQQQEMLGHMQLLQQATQSQLPHQPQPPMFHHPSSFDSGQPTSSHYQPPSIPEEYSEPTVWAGMRSVSPTAMDLRAPAMGHSHAGTMPGMMHGDAFDYSPLPPQRPMSTSAVSDIEVANALREARELSRSIMEQIRRGRTT